MFRTSNIITKGWKEAGSFAAQINLYGFWDEHCFLTKSGDLGCALRIGGIDYESLDHAGLDYAVKRLEAAFRSLDEKTRLYQILFKRNRPAIAHSEYKNPLVRTAVEQRSEFLQSKADRLYSIEIFWVVMIEGSYAKTGLLHALAQLPKQPSASLRDLYTLFSSSKERTLLYEQIERDRLRLQQKVQSLSGQLNDLTEVELLGAEKTFRLVRRLVNFRPSKIQEAPLCGARHLDWQVCDSELEAHRGYTEREAAFLYLVAVHSGYFLRRQFDYLTDRNKGAIVMRFLEKARIAGHIEFLDYKQGWHVYHLFSRSIYRLLGNADSQNRRRKGDAQVRARLMALDYVLENDGDHHLESEAERLRFFAEDRKIAPDLFTGNNGKLPPLLACFPISLTDRTRPAHSLVRFTFIDEGLAGVEKFLRFLSTVDPLLRAVGNFEVIYVSASDFNFPSAKAAFWKRFSDTPSMTPRLFDEDVRPVANRNHMTFRARFTTLLLGYSYPKLQRSEVRGSIEGSHVRA